jgi:hypothetical protein
VVLIVVRRTVNCRLVQTVTIADLHWPLGQHNRCLASDLLRY